MTMVMGGPRDFEVRIKRLIVLIPRLDGDELRSKDVVQQYLGGQWRDIDIVREEITMPFDKGKEL